MFNCLSYFNNLIIYITSCQKSGRCLALGASKQFLRCYELHCYLLLRCSSWLLFVRITLTLNLWNWSEQLSTVSSKSWMQLRKCFCFAFFYFSFFFYWIIVCIHFIHMMKNVIKMFVWFESTVKAKQVPHGQCHRYAYLISEWWELVQNFKYF